ncbi:type II toxin-antitoxin system BrnA family antitoxin [Desulfonatronum thioautotrophicum]|uniref:type II toxin-antitoxin system BrnA family antitoxin n=1 Tax=Desulfonatronum thioautotrophicum TaxID=617001 RepID=UPI001ABF76AC|nr:CopG family antitoxin [Desulfonatronum thioautotrophicum]
MDLDSPLKAEEFDRRFDNREDVSDYLDFSQAKRPGLEKQTISFSFPSWMISSMADQAKILGVSAEAMVTIWISEKLRKTHRHTFQEHPQ